ncbi:Ion transport domain [Trinorchestia longiramus]|nr:Ion transport domain [Trinorchestia longiramus]
MNSSSSFDTEQPDSASVVTVSQEVDTNDDEVEEPNTDELPSFHLEVPEYLLSPKIDTRQRLRRLVHSTSYQVVLMVLVVTEAVLVVSELAMEADHGDENVITGLHVASLLLLAIFAAELLFRLCICPLETLKSWAEVLDGVVVVAAIVLESYSFHHRGAAQAAGLLITLRLWRIVRILNNMRVAVHLADQRKLQQETQRRRKLELQLRDLKHVQKTLEETQSKCAALERELHSRGIHFHNEEAITKDVDSEVASEAQEIITKVIQ